MTPEETIDKARKFLRSTGIFFYDEESELDDGESREMLQTINMNDTWGWASADGEYVPDEELPALKRLFWQYGWCGVLYWVSQRRGGARSEFHDINRFIDFVANEERIRAGKSSSEYAYTKAVYTLGEPVASNG